MEKNLIISHGRFNPPTRGHERHFEEIWYQGIILRCPHVILVSHTQNKSNPLPQGYKIELLRKLFPYTNFYPTSKEIPTVFKYLETLDDVENVYFMCGEDRKKEFSDSLNKFNRKLKKFNRITCISSGFRTLYSASSQRESVKKNDFVSFKYGCPHSMTYEQSKDLFNLLRSLLTNI